MKKLAPHVYATHIKDLNVQKGVPADEWYFFPALPSEMEWSITSSWLVSFAKLIMTAS